MYRPEFVSGLIFITALIFITVKIAFIFMSLSTVHIYDFHIFTIIYYQKYFNRYKLRGESIGENGKSAFKRLTVQSD